MSSIDPIGPLRRDVPAVDAIPGRVPDERRERRRDDEPREEPRPPQVEEQAPDCPPSVRDQTEQPGDGPHVDVRA